MKLKFTVSELKKRESLREEAGEELIQEPEIVPLLPHFVEEQDEGLTGTSRGSAYHKFLELHDFSKEYTEKLLKEEIEQFYQAGRLSKEMADCIRTKDILAFLNSESGRRMTQAAGNGKLWKEQPFVLGVAVQRFIRKSIRIFRREVRKRMKIERKRPFSSRELLMSGSRRKTGFTTGL